jgi:hypothetical protein
MKTPQMLRLGTANDASFLRPTLQDGIEAALSVTDSMIDEMLGSLVAAFDSDQAAGPVLARWDIDPAVVLRLVETADTLKQTWHRQLRRVFYHGSVMDEAAPELRFDDLRRLDDQQIDASIGFAVAEAEIRQACAEILPRLNALVSSLMGWMTVQPELNPLRPRAYAHALREVLLQHVEDDAQRNALFAPLGGMLGESLRQVYRELVQWLLVHGVEPVEAAAPPSDSAPPSAMGRTLLTLSRLRQLLAGDLNHAEAGSEGFVQTVPLSLTALEDMDLIESLMQRLRERGGQRDAMSDRPEVPIVLEPNLGRLLGQEVVRCMLDHLTRDVRLLPAIRQQIGLLEPVLIRLSQADPRFFSERQHPARQLLEEITERSLGYQSHHDEGFSDLLASVSGAVRALGRAAATEEVFARLLTRLRRRWEEDDGRKNRMRADAARALLHAEQRHLLAERLAVDIQQLLQGKDVPEFVARFLVGPWAQALAQSRLGGASPVDAVETLDSVADELIWSAQAPLIRRDPERLAWLVPRLLQRLRQGLEGIEYPPELTGRFFDALVSVHERAFDGRTDSPRADSSVSETGEAFWMADSEVHEAGFLPEAQPPATESGTDLGAHLLATGAWVDLQVDGGWVRAQLTWTSPQGGLFMFISSRGMAHSMTRRTLERLRNNGALCVVSRGGMVEGALDAVARQALHNESQADTSSDSPPPGHAT